MKKLITAAVAAAAIIGLSACSSDADVVYGMCTACGSVEVALMQPTGSRNLSHIGESDTYPTGHGCEMCN
ncbi:hypothetical protein PBI_TWEETY_40 [Mycobacterium phage Tweety]|uniref:Lipoprotein n=1 Tax=Mycobacterium phage Tweety TaxID=439809 RepID=A5YK08_9CAUD|nr:hypothetical protein PBI_TWEETY_40 [Mycobacterium phage Tweety]ABQ86109.1 hypothetical protein PBI_TWEETY_40 [Mycobacterium phage Tweety]